MEVDEEPKIQSASGSLPKESESMAKSTERKEGGAMQGNSLQRPQAQSLQRNFTPHPPRGLTLQQSTDRRVTQHPAIKWGGTGHGRIEDSAQVLMQSAASGKVGNGNPGSQPRTDSASTSGHIRPEEVIGKQMPVMSVNHPAQAVQSQAGLRTARNLQEHLSSSAMENPGSQDRFTPAGRGNTRDGTPSVAQTAINTNVTANHGSIVISNHPQVHDSGVKKRRAGGDDPGTFKNSGGATSSISSCTSKQE